MCICEHGVWQKGLKNGKHLLKGGNEKICINSQYWRKQVKARERDGFAKQILRHADKSVYSPFAIASQFKLNCGADGLDTFVRPSLLLLFRRNLANPALCYARRSPHFLFHFARFNDDFCCYHHHHKLVYIFFKNKQNLVNWLHLVPARAKWRYLLQVTSASYIFMTHSKLSARDFPLVLRTIVPSVHLRAKYFSFRWKNDTFFIVFVARASCSYFSEENMKTFYC